MDDKKTQNNGEISLRGDFWASSVEILVFPISNALNMVFSVTNYSELHVLIYVECSCYFLPSKVLMLISCPNNQFDLFWEKCIVKKIIMLL